MMGKLMKIPGQEKKEMKSDGPYILYTVRQSVF